MNITDKYIIKANKREFEIKDILGNNIVLKYLDDRETITVTKSYFIDAVKKKAIVKLLKSKSYQHPEWLQKYLIERDKLIDAENRDKTA